MLERAQAALSSAKSIVLPELILHFYSNKKPVLLAPPQRISLERTERCGEVLDIYSADKHFLLAINPGASLVATLKNSTESALCITCKTETDNFEDDLINGALNKVWLYNVYAHNMLRRYIQAAEPLRIMTRNARRQVAGCPRQVRVYHGAPYALLDVDCRACEYCIDSTEADLLYCTGRSRVILPEDFNKPPEARTDLYPEMRQPLKTEQVQAGMCPLCGGKLVEREGPSGNFLSCSHYPFCRFTGNYQKDGCISFNVKLTQGET